MRTVRPRRSIWFGIGVVAAFFAAVTLAIGWVGSGAPGIPHAVGGDRATCATCHPTDRLPEGHRGRIDDSCRSCHPEGSADADAAGGQAWLAGSIPPASSDSRPPGTSV